MQNKAFHRLLHQLDNLTPTQSKQAQDYIKHKCSRKRGKRKKGSGHNPLLLKGKRGQDTTHYF